jgi:membrane-associated protease RseP (regulator of RpoE activity)
VAKKKKKRWHKNNKRVLSIAAMKSHVSAVLLAVASASTTLAFQSPINNHVKTSIYSPAAVAYAPKHHHVSQQKPKLSTTTTELHSIAPAAALSAVGSPLGSIAVLAFVILVHEAGHFIAARSFGIEVDEFSVGVGPRIVGVRRKLVDSEYVFDRIDDAAEPQQNQDDDGIEFSLRAIPLGGYVRFPENYNRTLAFEMEDAARRARNKARLLRIENSNAVEKALENMAAYSFIFNVVSLGLLKKWQSKRVEDQLKEAEEEALITKATTVTKKPWWGALSLGKGDDDTTSDESLSTLELLKSAKAPDVEYDANPDLLQNRPAYQRAVVLSGGVVFNILLAFACYFGELTVGRGLPEPIFNPGVVVSQTVSNDSPAYGVLKKGDVILGVNEVSSISSSKRGIWGSQEQISNVISTIRETQNGEDIKLTIVHGMDSATDVVSVSPKRNLDGQASIGVMLGPNYVKTEMVPQ